MRKLKGYIPTTALMLTLVFGSSVANAGIIITTRAEPTPTCEETKIDLGLGSLVKAAAQFALTGIIITTAVDPRETCGIIITT
jgi:hypothetical protein